MHSECGWAVGRGGERSKHRHEVRLVGPGFSKLNLGSSELREVQGDLVAEKGAPVRKVRVFELEFAVRAAPGEWPADHLAVVAIDKDGGRHDK
jgi:hypothetical protein